MFKRTQIQLTLLNSLVFVILIGAIGLTIYYFMYQRLYKDVDNSLRNAVSFHEDVPHFDNREEKKPRELGFSRDPRLSFIVRDKNNQVIASKGEISLLLQNESSIKPKAWNSIQQIKVEDFAYRTIAVKDEGVLGGATLQVFRNVDSENNLLDQLLIIMISGCSIGVVLAVVAGYYLARRALVPIQNAWDKQQQFVSDASHELRTPLAVIQSKTDLLFRSPSSTIQEKALDISIISKECRRLAKLVTNLLTLARSDSNQIEVDKKEFSMNEVLNDIMMTYEDLALYQGKTLLLHTSANIQFVGDKEKIHQLLIILLDNALKYTKEDGKIVLTCSQNASSIIVQVEDDGIGIAEEEQSKIFDRFYQSDKARTVSEGAGLGLSIAKWIIDKHQGKVRVHSQLGKGTRFEIIFPKNQKK